MLQKQTTIAGYDGFVNRPEEMLKEQHGARVYFKVESEEMPARSREAGRIVRENFVWIYKEMDLGRSKLSRRIRDKVQFDPETRQWKVLMLAERSDIERYTNEWNAFVAGHKENEVGTPLSLLFKNDPSKVEEYARYGIRFVEQLAALTEANASEITLDGRNNKKKAEEFLSRVESQAPGIRMDSLIAKKDEEIAFLKSQFSELSEKLTKLMTEKESEEPETEAPRRRGRPPSNRSSEMSDSR